VNRIRVWPGADGPPAEQDAAAGDLDALAAALRESEGPDYPADLAAQAAADGAKRYAALVRRDAESTEPLRKRIEGQRRFWSRIPEFDTDVHSLANLGRVADWFCQRTPESGPGGR